MELSGRRDQGGEDEQDEEPGITLAWKEEQALEEGRFQCLSCDRVLQLMYVTREVQAGCIPGRRGGSIPQMIEMLSNKLLS